MLWVLKSPSLCRPQKRGHLLTFRPKFIEPAGVRPSHLLRIQTWFYWVENRLERSRIHDPIRSASQAQRSGSASPRHGPGVAGAGGSQGSRGPWGRGGRGVVGPGVVPRGLLIVTFDATALSAEEAMMQKTLTGAWRVLGVRGRPSSRRWGALALALALARRHRRVWTRAARLSNIPPTDASFITSSVCFHF